MKTFKTLREELQSEGKLLNLVRGWSPEDIEKEVNKLSSDKLKAIVKKANPKSARRVLSPKAYAKWSAAYNRLQTEAKKVDFDFDDLDPVDYKPGEDKFSKRNARKRKRADVEHESCEYPSTDGSKKKPTPDEVKRKTSGTPIEADFPNPKLLSKEKSKQLLKDPSKSVKEDADLNEVLNVAQRRKRAIIMRRNKAKIKRGSEKARKRIADKDRLENRAKRRAKSAAIKKLTRGVSKGDLSPQRRAEIERRLQKMKGRISRQQKKLLPTVRKDDRGL